MQAAGYLIVKIKIKIFLLNFKNGLGGRKMDTGRKNAAASDDSGRAVMMRAEFMPAEPTSDQ